MRDVGRSEVVGRATRVTIVEDDEATAELLLIFLRAEGYDAIVRTGPEAIDLVDQTDVVVLDLSLPDLDGFEVCRRLKAAPAPPQVLICSARASISARAEAFAAGADQYLSKPFDLDELLSRVAALARAARADERLRFQAFLLDRVWDAVIATDLDGRVTYWNRGATGLFGWSASEMLGQTLARLSPARGLPDDGVAALRAEAVYDGEWLVRARAGHEVATLMHIEPLVAGDERTGALLVGRDVSALKERQEREARADKLRALGEMAAGVAHDLNNVLAMIAGGLEMLLHPGAGVSLGPAELRHLELLHEAALDGGQVVARLQRFARERSGTDRLAPVDLAGVGREVAELTRPRWRDMPREQGRQVELRLQLSPVPPVLGNVAELREVLTNLVFNAVDAMPEGGALTLRTRLGDGRVALDVIDSGSGMPEHVRRRVFDPYFSTKGERGTGLGLAISQAIVERHGGELTVTSAPGRGSTFTLWLPPAPLAPLVAPREVVEDGGVEGRPERLRLLCVEDEVALRTILGRTLEALGHSVTLVDSAEDALEALGRETYDALLTDVGLPGKSGLELARLAREQREDLPVVLLTGWGAGYDAAFLEREGLGDAVVIPKPYRQAQIVEALARLGR